MYEKVIFGTICKTVSGRILGKDIGGFSGKVVFQDNDGNQCIATYGILDDNDRFHEYCTSDKCCGENRFNANSSSCRYNRKYVSSAGYYVRIP